LNDPQYPQNPGTVNFYVNDKLIGSKPVNDPADTVSITYSPTSSGSATVRAQVIDSVLYDSSDSKSVSFSGVGGNVKFESATLTSATWSGGIGPYSVRRDDNNAEICNQPAGSTGCTYALLPNNTQITITDLGTGKTDSKKVHP
jgi:hypothetical protein